MADTAPQSPNTPARISLALRLNDHFITSALGLRPDASTKPNPMSARQARRRDAGLLWLHNNQSALVQAFDADDQAEVQRLKGLLLDLLDPQWSNWAYAAIFVLFAPLACFSPTPLFFTWAMTHPILQAVCVCLPTILLRVYHTFRSRILSALGYQPERPNEIVKFLMIDFCESSFAVGNPAYRAAPLSAAWPGLTGKERGQPAWYRTLSLVLVIFVATGLELIVLPSLLAFATGSAFHAAGRDIPSLRLGRHQFGFNYQMGSKELTRTILAQIQRTLSHIGYRWDARHPLVRGFTDQLLATYRLPNPTRDADFAHDATVAASASASNL